MRTKEICNCLGDVISLIDEEDFPSVSKYEWSITPYGYIYCNKSKIFLHNLIMGINKHCFQAEVDHINRYRWDNRKSNLRIVSRQINNLNTGMQKNNTSGYKGVAWHKQRGKWRAYIMLDYKQISLGLYNNKEDAYKARLEKENEIMSRLLEEYNDR